MTAPPVAGLGYAASHNGSSGFLGMHSQQQAAYAGYNGDGRDDDDDDEVHNDNDNNNNDDDDSTNNTYYTNTQNNHNRHHSKTSTTMKTTTTTTISTVTETINESTTYPEPAHSHHAHGHYPSSAHSQSQQQHEPWSHAYSFDEYKQAPTPQFNHHDQPPQQPYPHNSYHEFGDRDHDESKVMDDTHLDGNTATYHRHRDDVDFRVDAQPKKETFLLPQWTCPSCSVLNKAGTNECELCSSIRPSIESDDTDEFDDDDEEEEEDSDEDDDDTQDEDDDDEEEEEDEDDDMERHHRDRHHSRLLHDDTSQRSPSFTLDFDFDAQEVLARADSSTNVSGLVPAATAVSDAQRNEKVSLDTPLLQDLFFGTLSRHHSFRTNGDSDDDQHSIAALFSIGDRVLHQTQTGADNGDGESVTIQGTVVEIRDVSESPFPIKIEYFVEECEQRNVRKYLWVLPEELLKINCNTNQTEHYDDDILYDYEDDDDDDDEEGDDEEEEEEEEEM